MAAKLNVVTKDEPLVVERTSMPRSPWSGRPSRQARTSSSGPSSSASSRRWSASSSSSTSSTKASICRHRCKVTEAIPNKRLAYTWRYEGHPAAPS